MQQAAYQQSLPVAWRQPKRHLCKCTALCDFDIDVFHNPKLFGAVIHLRETQKQSSGAVADSNHL